MQINRQLSIFQQDFPKTPACSWAIPIGNRPLQVESPLEAARPTAVECTKFPRRGSRRRLALASHGILDDMCVYVYPYKYIYIGIHTLHWTTLHYIALHSITLHHIAFYYIALHYITLHCITLHYTTLHYIHTYMLL